MFFRIKNEDTDLEIKRYMPLIKYLSPCKDCDSSVVIILESSTGQDVGNLSDVDETLIP